MTNPKCPECGIEIDDHPIARCLDWWIAKDVIGSKVLGFECWKEYNRGKNYYSRFIDDAWEVVGTIRGSYECKMHNGIIIMSDPNGWYVEFPKPSWQEITAPTAPLAICRAAIKAVAEER